MGWAWALHQQKAALLMSSAWLKPSCSTFPGVRFPESCQDEVRDQKQLLKDAAAFLLSCQIPGLVREGVKGWVGAAKREAVADLVASCSLVSRSRIEPPYGCCIGLS